MDLVVFVRFLVYVFMFLFISLVLCVNADARCWISFSDQLKGLYDSSHFKSDTERDAFELQMALLLLVPCMLYLLAFLLNCNEVDLQSVFSHSPLS